MFLGHKEEAVWLVALDSTVSPEIFFCRNDRTYFVRWRYFTWLVMIANTSAATCVRFCTVLNSTFIMSLNPLINLMK